MEMIDLRSDTVTLPSEAMREAIYKAELGDDVFEEDPTTNRLELEAARRMGKEAALLVPSGTMANLVSVLTHCARGEEAILGDRSHIFLNEAGSMSTVGSIHPHTIPNQPDGTLRLEDIEAAVRGPNVHWPRSRLVLLESTHNRCYGAPLTSDYIASVARLAMQHGLKIHLDGARIFNAAVALNTDPVEFSRHVDSISFCLSKGLSAPVGSLVCGSKEFISEARRNRKVLGGGMRQCGIIAASGLVALDQMIGRLEEDHKYARKLAKGIAQIPGLSIELRRIRTNIIYFDLDSDCITAEEFLTELDKRGIRILSTDPSRFRMVTHYGITSEDIDKALVALREVMKK